MRISLPLRTSLFFLTLFALTSCSDKASMPGKAFEGKITQKITLHGNALKELEDMEQQSAASPLQEADSASAAEADMEKKMQSVLSTMTINMDMTMYVRADKLAYDVSTLGGLFKIHAIVDPMTRKLTMLLPGKQALVTDLKKIDKERVKIDDSLKAHPEVFDELLAKTPRPTGKKEEINGFDCEQYILEDEREGKKIEVETWITTDPRLKFYDVIRDAFLGKNRTGEMGGMEELMSAFEMFAGEGKVPVKMSMRINGKDFMTSELQEMVEEKLDNSHFEIPAGYTITEQDLLAPQSPPEPVKNKTESERKYLGK